MDGNGRWAVKRGLPRSEGHREGVNALKRVLEALDGRIPVASFYAFSTENWRRPPDEIKAIFSLVEELSGEYLSKEGFGYALNFFGDISALPPSVRRSVEKAREKTKNNKGTIVNIMLNYGGRGEIVRAAKKLADTKKEFTEKNLSALLYTGYLPDPDLIVRTAGEKRLSNFMPFQSVYSELLFLEKLWPDMDGSDVEGIIAEYNKRKRTFGK
jgi:undecaprenyl diphosphate synthase